MGDTKKAFSDIEVTESKWVSKSNENKVQVTGILD